MINKEAFFRGFREYYKKQTGKRTVSASVVKSVEYLLERFNNDSKWKDIRHVAYAFATMAIETGWTFAPIKEFRGKTLTAQQAKYWNTGFYGRGYVQITWEANYKKASQKLGVDFVNNPDLVMQPEHAFNIMTRGMHEGWFTGKKLSDYINSKTKDYRNARRIINGVDAAAKIAGFAESFESILKEASAVVFQEPTKLPKGTEPVKTNPRKEDGPVGDPWPNEAPATPVEKPVSEEIKKEVVTIEEVSSSDIVTMKAVEADKTSGWGTWVANVRAQIASLGLGGISLGSLNFIKDPVFVKVALGVLGAALLASITVYVVTLILKNKDKREREQRAHELTLKEMELAADPNKITVKVVKKGE